MPNHPYWPSHPPTHLTAPHRSDMPIAQEELFAPIFLVLSFSTLSEAVSLANSTRYGLGSSIFSSNRAEALAVARALDCGMVNINDFGVSYLNQGLPFGGTKKSGYGRFAGPEGLRALTAPKAVTQDRFFGWLRTGIPKPLDYPLKDALKSWKCEVLEPCLACLPPLFFPCPSSSSCATVSITDNPLLSALLPPLSSPSVALAQTQRQNQSSKASSFSRTETCVRKRAVSQVSFADRFDSRRVVLRGRVGGRERLRHSKNGHRRGIMRGRGHGHGRGRCQGRVDLRKGRRRFASLASSKRGRPNLRDEGKENPVIWARSGSGSDILLLC